MVFFKPKLHSKLVKQGAQAIIILVLVGLCATMIGSIINTVSTPGWRATLRADAMIVEQRDSDLKACVQEAKRDPEKINDCKAEYINQDH